jgi:hypothetical protein
MPLLKWGALDVKKIGYRLWKVTIEVTNDKIIPSRTAMAARHHIGLPDVLTCATTSTNHVATSGTVRSLLPTTKLSVIESEQPQRIVVNQGISGNGSTLFQFIVGGFGDIVIEYKAEKGGVLSRKVQLKDQFTPKTIEHRRAIPKPTTK